MDKRKILERGASHLSRKYNSFGGIRRDKESFDKGIILIYNSNMKNYKSRIGFTLAEVLVTLGIIGVVAALTIPTLITKYQEKQTVTRFKWIYSTLANAYTMAIAENGSPVNWELNNKQDLAEILSKYMRVAEKCYYKKGCLPNYIEDVALSGETRFGHLGDYTTHVKERFNNGIVLLYNSANNGCSYVSVDGEGNETLIKDNCGQITAFISPNKVNRLGLDHFGFVVTPKGILPHGYNNSDNYIKNACSKENKLLDGNKASNGTTCGEWIRRWGNADYWYGDE